MEKPRICIVVSDLAVGGLPKVVLSIIKKLDLQSFQYYLLNLSDQEELIQTIGLPPEVKYKSIPLQFPDGYGLIDHVKFAFLPTYTKRYANEAIQWLIDLKPDLIHFQTRTRQIEIGHLVRRTNPNTKILYSEHSMRISRSEYSWHQYLGLRMVIKRHLRNTKLIAISESVKGYLKEFLPKQRHDDVYLIPNRIDVDKFKGEIKSSSPPINVLCISRVSHLKRQATLIEAWGKLDHSKKGSLMIIGPDESHGEIPKLAENDPSIQFLGSRSNIIEFMQQCQISVCPSSKEGLPLALLESMANGMGIIVSDIKEHTSIVDEHVHALYFKLDDSSDLANKLFELMSDNSKIGEMGKAAMELASERYNSNDWNEEYEKLYHKVLSE